MNIKNIWIGLGLAILVLVLVFVLVGYFIIQNSNSPVAGSDITMYPVQCDDWFPTNYDKNNTNDNSNEPKGDARNFQNCLQKRALDRIAFKIDKANSEVIEWDPDNTSSGLIKNTGCTIVDSNNWSCNTDGFLGDIMGFGSNNGIVFNNEYTHVLFVSKRQWNSINNGAPTPFGADIPK